MANRRMFSLDVIDSDAFLDMPNDAQNLYFHLAMRADDDGFVNSPKKIQKIIGASDDAAKILLAKKFIIVFDSGVIVIKHWRMHNYIQNDRYKETNYKEEKSTLVLDENKAYSQCIQDVSKTETQVRLELGKSKSKSKDSLEIEIEESATPLKVSNIEPFSFTLKKDTHFDNLSDEYKNALKIEIEALGMGLPYQAFVEALQAKASYKYKNFLLAYKNWAKKDFNKGNRATKYDGMVENGQISKEVANTMDVLDRMKW